MENDVVRNLLIGASVSVPFVGGVLSLILDKSIPSYIKNQYERFVEEIEFELDRLSRDINQCNIESPEFISICYKVLQNVVVEYYEEKRMAYKNILLNTIIDTFNTNTVDYYIKLVDMLSIEQFRVLNYLYLEKKQDRNCSIYLKQLRRENLENKFYITSMISELARLILITNGTISNLGFGFCEFINSPQNIYK